MSSKTWCDLAIGFNVVHMVSPLAIWDRSHSRHLCDEYASDKLTPDQFREAINDLNLHFDMSVKNDKSLSLCMNILDANGDGYIHVVEFQKFYYCVILQATYDPSRLSFHM